jgi:hypothetical protein
MLLRSLYGGETSHSPTNPTGYCSRSGRRPRAHVRPSKEVHDGRQNRRLPALAERDELLAHIIGEEEEVIRAAAERAALREFLEDEDTYMKGTREKEAVPG